MSGPTAIRLAALLALGYGLWILAGGPMHVGAGEGAMTLRVSAGHWVSWLVGLVSLLLAWGLWVRQAWSWWLAIAAALVQGWRLVSAHVAHGGVARLPNTTTLVVLALLLAFLVLLFMPKARTACNR
jgi:cation transport ATPase